MTGSTSGPWGMGRSDSEGAAHHRHPNAHRPHEMQSAPCRRRANCRTCVNPKGTLLSTFIESARSRRLRWSVLLVLAGLLLLTACDSDGSEQPTATPTATTTATATATTNATDTTDPASQRMFHRTVMDARGIEVTFSVEPEAIAVLNLPALGDPLLTLGYEILAAPGASAVDQYRYLPEGALADTVDIGTSREIDLEALAAAAPELIIATDQNAEIYDQLDAIAPTYVVSTADIGTDRWTIIEQLADALGGEDELAAYRADYVARVAELRPHFDGHTLSFARLVPDALLTYHEHSPIGVVLEEIGFDVTEAEAGAGTPSGGENYIVELSAEQVGQLTGEYLIVYNQNLASDEARALLETDVWQAVPAVAAGRYVIIDTSETDFLLLPWGRYGTMHDLDVLEDLLVPLVQQ